MAKTVSDLGPEVSQQYRVNQQIREEQSSQIQESGRVAALAQVQSMTPTASETLSLLGLDQIRRPFAWLPAPEGFGVARLGVFGIALAGSLGDTARLRQLVQAVETMSAAQEGAPSAAERDAVLAGLKQLAASSELHDEINVQTAEFLKG
jgi:hypothetical protein